MTTLKHDGDPRKHDLPTLSVAIKNGLIIPKERKILEYFGRNIDAFGMSDLEIQKGLYPPQIPSSLFIHGGESGFNDEQKKKIFELYEFVKNFGGRIYILYHDKSQGLKRICIYDTGSIKDHTLESTFIFSHESIPRFIKNTWEYENDLFSFVGIHLGALPEFETLFRENRGIVEIDGIREKSKNQAVLAIGIDENTRAKIGGRKFGNIKKEITGRTAKVINLK